ncbi:GMC family oxidoreductase [Nocardia farcinica]|uniref:GMC oxidoreductase n=2 Tax=Nocardia TaxID=1817 RepID=UPI000A3858B9|nr:GMC family oxidoreductase [Nocardia farcinica]MBA4855389.1 GMC family oxidoreductase [Nocardia farcinica]MBC9818272.1 GMC family oxidoreductase [Nocardia farcinica]MBF6067680.1 GMC family oxidoreductase [Nocardia farcinica]MBF6249768.1 GMC family oxidoreductase [Nocardia farcinica]MBF6261088.1 GMC family oxidoreductase [Nocardia farcinica]
MAEFDYDVVVIGSGFGGSVAALRLTEKGYRVGVLEAGRRWDAADLPATNWNLRKSIWAPKLGLTGPQQISILGKCAVFSGAGVGGGSLIYGNTLYEPLPAFYTDRQWAHITDWRSELAPYYDQAKRMLGVAPNPRTTPADEIIKEVAEDIGVADTFHPTQVGVFFNEDRQGEEVDDPYFGGAGPRRSGCVHCARCFTGCPHNAKNTTTTNYLYLAEQAGARVHELTTATAVRPLPGGGYAVDTERSGRWIRKEPRTFTAEQVVFAGAALGTQKLLHRMRDEGVLPGLSPRLGELTRSNSEAILNVASRSRYDFAQGVAITSSIHPEPNTHVEVCHYGKGQNALATMAVPLVDGGAFRFLRFLLAILTHPLAFLRSRVPYRGSEKSVILLVMQSLDNSLTSFRKRGALRTEQGTGEPNPTWIPLAHDIARRFADKIDGDTHGLIMDVFNIPATAHYIGGCVIGETPRSGVVDPYQRVFGHPGLHVADGSAVTANLGVNPSLTITAQAERAMAFWPNKGEPDPRPELGAPYRRIDPVRPVRPTVPEHAPGALRLPITPVDPPVPAP